MFTRLPQSVRYLLVGGISATIDLILFTLFHLMAGLDYLLIGVLGFIAATTVNYLLSIHCVFNSGVRFARHQEWMMVYLVSLIGLALHTFILYTGVEKLLLNPLWCKITAIGIVFVWNYGARKYYVFKPAN